MREQLQKLNSEIDDIAGKAEATWNAYIKERERLNRRQCHSGTLFKNT